MSTEDIRNLCLKKLVEEHIIVHLGVKDTGEAGTGIATSRRPGYLVTGDTDTSYTFVSRMDSHGIPAELVVGFDAANVETMSIYNAVSITLNTWI